MMVELSDNHESLVDFLISKQSEGDSVFSGEFNGVESKTFFALILEK